MSTGESGKMRDCETQQNMDVTGHGAEQNFPVYQIQTIENRLGGNFSEYQAPQNSNDGTPVANGFPIQNAAAVHNCAPVANGIPIQNAATVHNCAPVANGIPIQNAATVHNCAPVANGIPIQNAAAVHNCAPVANGIHIQNAAAVNNGAPVAPAVYDAASVHNPNVFIPDGFAHHHPAASRAPTPIQGGLSMSAEMDQLGTYNMLRFFVFTPLHFWVAFLCMSTYM